ncbi:hypothetical protein [Nonomuraea sp. CA-141351]|uniref:hypothetical protein n=1 Tax=Nonomuraea sp. CA-141351 TaxID=3239996 RepID=UPI003D8B67FC
MTTRAEALAAAGRVLAEARARRDALSPEDAARAAYVPGGRSVEELTAIIREQRRRARARQQAGLN